MNQIDAMALEPHQFIVELKEESIVSAAEKCHPRISELCAKMRQRSLAKRQALTVAMLGILAMPVVAILSSDENQLEKLQLLVQSERSANDKSAILAVDTSAVRIRSNRASAATLESLEQTTVEHLAKLHSTYREWAEKNQALMGSLLIKLIVDASGSVARVEPIAAHLSNVDFVKTIIADMRAWKFPKNNANGAEVTVPLLFIPKGMDSDTVVQWERTVRGEGGAKLNSTVMTGARPFPMKPLMNINSPTDIPAQPPSTAATAIAKAKTQPTALATVKANRQLAIRDNPRYSGKSLRDVDQETPLSILENRGDWLKVRLADAGPIGFVRKEYVSPIN